MLSMLHSIVHRLRVQVPFIDSFHLMDKVLVQLWDKTLLKVKINRALLFCFYVQIVLIEFGSYWILTQPIFRPEDIDILFGIAALTRSFHVKDSQHHGVFHFLKNTVKERSLLLDSILTRSKEYYASLFVLENIILELLLSVNLNIGRSLPLCNRQLPLSFSCIRFNEFPHYLH